MPDPKEAALDAYVALGGDFSHATNYFAAKQLAEEPGLAAYLNGAEDLMIVSDGVCEIADPGIVSKGEDNGAYVLAWVWVCDEDAGIEHDELEVWEGSGAWWVGRGDGDETLAGPFDTKSEANLALTALERFGLATGQSVASDV